MKIVRLTIENFLRLNVVEIEPTTNTVIIKGKNAQGKTSILEALFCALGGTRVQPKEPIRRGQKKARVELDLGEILVTRTWSGKGSYLRIENKKGEVQKSPQELLNSLFNAVTYDPSTFVAAPAKEQRETILTLADIKDELGVHDARIDESKQARRDINRDYKAVETKLGREPLGKEIKKLEAGELFKELQAGEAINRELSKYKSDLGEKETKAKEISDDIVILYDDIEKKKQQLEQVEEEIATAKVKLKKIKPVDTAPIQNKITGIEGHNEQAVKWQGRKELKDELNDLRLLLKKEDKEIDLHETCKNELMTSAAFPLEGLSVDENGVTYQGTPFGQCSDAEKIKISMAIAIKLNPKIKVIRIKNAAFLDENNFRAIKEIADENDYQVWVEVINDATDKGGPPAMKVEISEGEIASIEEPEGVGK